MKLTKITASIGAVFTFLALHGCSNQPVAATPHAFSPQYFTHCPIESATPVIRWLNHEEVVVVQSGNHDLPNTSWKTLLVSMGTRPSGGYSISLAQPPFIDGHESKQLHIQYHAPSGMATQVITNPCVLISMEIVEPVRFKAPVYQIPSSGHDNDSAAPSDNFRTLQSDGL